MMPTARQKWSVCIVEYCVTAEGMVVFVIRATQLYSHARDCLQAVVNVGPGYWAVVLLSAVMTGFDGALSTVSTLVNEVTPAPNFPSWSHCGTTLLQAWSLSRSAHPDGSLQLQELYTALQVLHTVRLPCISSCNLSVAQQQTVSSYMRRSAPCQPSCRTAYMRSGTLWPPSCRLCCLASPYTAGPHGLACEH